MLNRLSLQPLQVEILGEVGRETIRTYSNFLTSDIARLLWSLRREDHFIDLAKPKSRRKGTNRTRSLEVAP